MRALLSALRSTLWSARRHAGRVWLLLACIVYFTCGGALAAAPPVELARADAGLHGARVPPNLLLNLSLTHAAGRRTIAKLRQSWQELSATIFAQAANRAWTRSFLSIR